MTFIQPNKHSGLMNVLLAFFAVALVAGTVGMIGLYNATVNTDRAITDMKTELDAIGARNIALNSEVSATLSGSDLTALAASDGLVAESKPTYFPLPAPAKWPIASHY
jgi:cell division protein FtsL